MKKINKIAKNNTKQIVALLFVALFAVAGTILLMRSDALTPTPGLATLTMTPAGGNFQPGSIVAVQVSATSSTTPLVSVQAAINYPASQLQYVSTTEGGTFTTMQRTNTATSGLVDIIRNVPGGSTGISGTSPVVTINFKVIGTSGAAALTYAASAGIYDASGTGTNVLDRTHSTAASFTLGGSAGGARLTMAPSTGSFLNGSTVSVDVNVTPGPTPVNTVEAAVSYPASQLQYLSATEGGVFTTQQRTNTATSGLVDIIRSLPGGSAGISSTTKVITLNFKVIGASGTVPLAFTGATAVYDTSGTGNSVFDGANSTAATYTITAQQAMLGDANGDGHVNAIDLSICVSSDGQNNPAVDFNKDGTVGAADLAILLGQWTW